MFCLSVVHHSSYRNNKINSTSNRICLDMDYMDHYMYNSFRSVLWVIRECSFEKCWGGAENGGQASAEFMWPPANQHGIYMPPPQIQYGICMNPPRQNQNTLYLRLKFIEYLYHISHNAMTSVMYFKQFGRTTLLYLRWIITLFIHNNIKQASIHSRCVLSHENFGNS